jgi:hypothetical protein
MIQAAKLACKSFAADSELRFHKNSIFNDTFPGKPTIAYIL